MRFLNFFVRIFNDSFMTHYITTIGRKIYSPYKENGLPVIAHECQHIWDSKRWPVLYEIGYLSPQIWFLLALGSFAAFASLWALLFLLALPLLAPLPAYFRMKIEMRGYAMTMAVWFWRTGRFTDFDYVADKFLGPDYFWMWPFKKAIRKRLKKIQVAIVDNSILSWSPIFKEVHEICEMSDAMVLTMARLKGGK